MNHVEEEDQEDTLDHVDVGSDHDVGSLSKLGTGSSYIILQDDNQTIILNMQLL